MIHSIGKSLEAVARRIRPYLSPAHRRAFAALVSRGLGEKREGEPVVCCDFTNPAIDAVGGRYYFSLVRDLIDSGYFPVFTSRRGTLSTFGTSRMKRLLLNERLGVIRSTDELDGALLLITDDRYNIPANAERVVVADYEWRICGNPGDTAFPVFVHPQIAGRMKSFKAPGPSEKRTARLFFGGNTEPGKYDKDVIRDLYQMLTRREMLDVANSAIPPDGIHKPTSADTWLSSQDAHPFVLCETQHCKIPQERWLEALAKADFFLACPGVGMPLCHNIVEALAAGCIPILQYADYLTPRLQHGINCLVFHDAPSLHDILKSILTMGDDEIIRLRGNVQSHYAEHLAPGCFAKRLFSGSPDRRTLLLNDYRVPR